MSFIFSSSHDPIIMNSENNVLTLICLSFISIYFNLSTGHPAMSIGFIDHISNEILLKEISLIIGITAGALAIINNVTILYNRFKEKKRKKTLDKNKRQKEG